MASKKQYDKPDTIIQIRQVVTSFDEQYKTILKQRNKNKANSLESFKKLNRSLYPVHSNSYLYDIETLGD